MRAQFATMSRRRSIGRLEGKHGLLLGLGGNSEAQPVATGDVNRTPQPFLQRLLDLAKVEDRGDPGRIHLHHDIHVAVLSVVAAGDRTEDSGVTNAHAAERGLPGAQNADDVIENVILGQDRHDRLLDLSHCQSLHLIMNDLSDHPHPFAGRNARRAQIAHPPPLIVRTVPEV